MRVSLLPCAKHFLFYLVSLSLSLRKAFPVLSGESLSCLAQSFSCLSGESLSYLAQSISCFIMRVSLLPCAKHFLFYLVSLSFLRKAVPVLGLKGKTVIHQWTQKSVSINLSSGTSSICAIDACLAGPAQFA